MKYSRMWSTFVVMIVITGAAALPLPALAQARDNRISVGGKLGWTLSDVRGDLFAGGETAIPFDWGHGFAAGGSLTLRIQARAAIQPELLFVRKRVRANTGDVTNVLTLDYVEIPVLFKVQVNDRAEGLAPFFVVGPAFSFVTAAEQRVELFGFEDVTDLSDEVTGSDVAVVFGGGIELLHDWGAITFDGRYQLGLRNVDGSGVDDVKLSTLMFLAGFRF